MRNIDDVASALNTLGQTLRSANLYSLENFNTTYLIITENVKYHLEEEAVFENPLFLQAFDARFAEYYFDALNRYLAGKPAPPAWEIAFDYCKQPGTSPLIAMALGVNAHINNDIPQVLLDCQAGNTHYADFERVNHIINSSIYQTIDSLHDDHSLLSPKRSFLRPAYRLAMNGLVRRWRRRAWQHFERLSEGTLDIIGLETRAQAIAGRLLKLPL